MDLLIESDRLEDYLEEVPPAIVFSGPLVRAKISEIEGRAESDEERARIAFEIARDEIGHSFDTKKEEVSISAEDTLRSCDGICYAKAHLLAALLRGMGIPVGFCYQRVLRKGTVDSGYALHGLNAIYLEPHGWFRVDPRGNKSGVHSEFSIASEKLAYPIRTELGEVDYPNVFAKPLTSVLEAMEDSASTEELFFKRPEAVG